MTFVVEDGSGIAGANAYTSVDVVSAYCSSHGLTFVTSPSTLGEQAIVRASSAIDAIYGGRYPGYRTNGRSQGLLWPRAQAWDNEYNLLDSEEIPKEIIQAVCEGAPRELATPNSLMPDLERGGDIRSIKAGSVQIVYGNSASASTIFQIIDGILAPLLNVGSAGGLFGTAVRI